MTLEHGRPTDCSGRLAKEIRTYDSLDSLGIEYDRVDHPTAMTMEDCAAIDTVLGTETCKNLFLANRQQTEFYLLMMPAMKPFKTKVLSSALGVSRLSFGDEKLMEEFLDITPGSLSVLGLFNDKEKKVRLIIDKELLTWESFGCHPCINTSSLRISVQDLIKKIIPATGHDFTEVELINE